MAINNTFDLLDGVDTSAEDSAAQRNLAEGSRLADAQEQARQERFDNARAQDEETLRFAGKYKSAEDLERAYLELQKKLGEKGEEPSDDVDLEEPVDAPEGESEPEDHASDDASVTEALAALTEASSEFYDNKASLSEETIEKLSKLDSRLLVETWANYIKSQNETVSQAAITAEQTSSIKEAVGGDANYNEMLGWAAKNLPPTEIASYDAVMNSGDYSAMYWAVQGLRNRYVSEEGYEGYSFTGARAPAAEPGYRSQAELARAISDPRYRNDPAYRIDVEDKLARSGSLL